MSKKVPNISSTENQDTFNVKITHRHKHSKQNSPEKFWYNIKDCTLNFIKQKHR